MKVIYYYGAVKKLDADLSDTSENQQLKPAKHCKNGVCLHQLYESINAAFSIRFHFA